MSTKHRLREYVRHVSRAKTRHGVHSPFVYEFVDAVLKKKIPSPAQHLMLVTSRHKTLANKIVAYFGCEHILWITNKDGEEETFISLKKNGDLVQLRSERYDSAGEKGHPLPDLYLFDLPDPADWQAAFDKYKDRLKEDSIILILSIHHSKEHTAAWQNIHRNDQVRLSLDLYKIGLLFFRKEFMEKQHFLLRSRSK